MRTVVMADGGSASGLVTHTMAGCHLLWYNPHPHAGCLNERAAILSIILKPFFISRRWLWRLRRRKQVTGVCKSKAVSYVYGLWSIWQRSCAGRV